MSGTGDSGGGRPRIDAAAKAAFVAGVRAGVRLQEVAAGLGFTAQAFYGARRRDAAFEAAWEEAHAARAEAERKCPSNMLRMIPQSGASSGGNDGEERIVSNNRRLYQRRKMRNVRFDAKRQQAFLGHFTWSCDTIAAAAETGVSERTVYLHLRNDAGFAAEFQEALEQGYVRLEAEALRQRLAAQQALRAAVEAAERGEGQAIVSGDMAAEFERVMKLLARWDRRGGGVGRREVRHGRQQSVSFEEAIVMLDRKLRALGLRRGIGTPDATGE